MKNRLGYIWIAGLSFLALSLAAPSLAHAQLGDAVRDLEDAARDLEDAAEDLEGAAEDLDRVEASAGSVDGIESPGTNTDGAMYSCDKHKRMVINFKPEEKKVLGDKKTPLVIKVSGHCDVVIRNVTLRGDVVIDVSGHVNMVLANVTIEGKRFGLEVSGHARVRVRNSTIAAGKKAMKVSGHSYVTVRDSKLKGRSTVSGYGHVAYDKKSKVGKLKKTGRYATLNRL